jgi:hypothetical protein
MSTNKIIGTLCPQRRDTLAPPLFVLLELFLCWLFGYSIGVEVMESGIKLSETHFCYMFPNVYYIISSTLNKQETFQSGSLPS